MTMDDETVLEATEVVPFDRRDRLWHRISTASKRLFMFGTTLVVLRIVLIPVLNGKSAPGLFIKCLGMTALTSFVVGTFLADLSVFHAWVKRPKPGQAGRSATRMNPISSLLLTCSLRSEVTEGIEKDILFAKTLLALFATIISGLVLIVLWTRQ